MGAPPQSIPPAHNTPEPPNFSRFFPSHFNCSNPARAHDDFEFDELDDMPLDDFDNALLARPPVDRRSQAQNGQARLTLARPTTAGPNGIERPSSSSEVPSSPLFRHANQRQARQLAPAHAPPMVQDIQLLPTTTLPDRFRSIFKFPLLNAIQSKSFDAVYNTDDNVVLSAPTGSGKTVIMELAICRLIGALKTEQYKIVYQAPTKSLCSERFRDWHAKFNTLGLQCAELTGDTEQSQLSSVQKANIIITTPEKWDSMTRKWKDHSRLMLLVRLFLIDEVHILKDSRGATLEAVVSRMKSVGSSVRFIALSATIPNAEDIATWLGKDAVTPHLPARLGKFGEEFRPVKLQKFVYGYNFKANDFAFDKTLLSKLPEVIAKHGNKKPIMIFCMTRKSCLETAQSLTKIFDATIHSHRPWRPPTAQVRVQDQDLQSTIASGVAFHHAGLDTGDRQAVEKGFLDGQVSIICCTSTLAVGVNLPCYLAIIKNTVAWQENGCKEYADLEIMQMLGRAGRPQFENHAVAVILTRSERVSHFEKMVTGQELLESCLHQNLLGHLNAEIGLGTVNDLHSAKRWLAGTFLNVRLGRNPSYYKIDEVAKGKNIDKWLEYICENDIGLLQENQLIESCLKSEGRFKCTAFGEAMAKYYVKFETMKLLLSLPPRAKTSEMVRGSATHSLVPSPDIFFDIPNSLPPSPYIVDLGNQLSVIAQAEELRDVRLKSGEKSLYKEVNNNPGIKYPMKVDIALPAHKVSLSIQAELGGVEYPGGEQFQKFKLQFQQDKNTIWQHIIRFVRCLVDCSIQREDSVAVRHALELARSFGARVWDNSPLQMKQIGGLGIVAVRKLASAGINSLEALELTKASRIDTIMSRNPPYGKALLAKVREFPKPRVTVKMMGKESKPGRPVTIRFKAEIGFINENAPTFFSRNPIFVCFLAETSDGRIIDFRRMIAKQLQNDYDMTLSADLHHPSQYIACHISCDEIAGTNRSAELKHSLPASLFPPPRQNSTIESMHKTSFGGASRLGSTRNFRTASQLFREEYDFGDDLNDNDLLAAIEEASFIPIESYKNENKHSHQFRKAATSGLSNNQGDSRHAEVNEPVRLDNGKWACNHPCKDKTVCKHLCCREGLDNPHKITKKTIPSAKSDQKNPREKAAVKSKKPSQSGQATLILGSRLPGTAKKSDSSIEQVNLTEKPNKKRQARRLSDDKKKLDLLHDKTSSQSNSFTPINHQTPSLYRAGKRPRLSFLSDSDSDKEPLKLTNEASSNYGGDWLDINELSSTGALLGGLHRDDRRSAKRSNSSKIYDENASDVEAGMIGLEDSLKLTNNHPTKEPWEDSSPEPMATNTILDDRQSVPPKNPPLIRSSNTVVGDNLLSSGSRLFVTPESVEAPFNRRIRPELTPVKRFHGYVGEEEEMGVHTKKPKRERSKESRPLSARKNAPSTPMDENVNDQKKEEGNEKKLENWWDGEDIDQDLVREFAPYVNFV